MGVPWPNPQWGFLTIRTVFFVFYRTGREGSPNIEEYSRFFRGLHSVFLIFWKFRAVAGSGALHTVNRNPNFSVPGETPTKPDALNLNPKPHTARNPKPKT